MISKETETALTDSQEICASSAEQVNRIEESLSLSGLFPSKSKLVNRLRSRCLLLSEEEYRMLKIRGGIVEGGDLG